MSTKPMRIYTPVTANQCITTPYAMIDGEVSYQPLLPKGSFDIELTAEVKKNRGVIYDESYSLVSKEVTLGQLVESGQIEMSMEIPNEDGNPEKTVAKIGLHKNSLPHLLANGVQEPKLKIDGTFGVETLNVFGQLTALGTLELEAIHFDADDDKHYAARMTKVEFQHDGTSTNRSILYPRSMAGDEQTTIRQLTNFNEKLDGLSYLEMPMYKGVSVNLTISTKFTRRA
jgi:hypothetical protein